MNGREISGDFTGASQNTPSAASSRHNVNRDSRAPRSQPDAGIQRSMTQRRYEMGSCAVNFSTIINASIGNEPGMWELLNAQINDDIDARSLVRSGSALERLALAECAVEDFAEYLDSFREDWERYKSSNRFCGARIMEETESVYQVVPPMYFSPDFGLERHEVFNQSLVQTMNQQEEMQDQLQKCLDLVEGRLFEQIELAHEERVFLNMLPAFKDIQMCVQRAVETTRKYRRILEGVKRDRLDAGLRTCYLSRKRERIREVLRRLELMKHVSMAPEAIHMLLSTHDFITALDLLENSTAVLQGDNGALKGVLCVKSISAKLTDLEEKFDSTVQAEFVTKTCEILFHPHPEPSCSLENVTACLIRRKILKGTINSSFRDVLLTKVKRFLKLQIAAEVEQQTSSGEESMDGDGDDEQVVSVTLSDRLKKLSYPQFLLFWEAMLTNVALRLATRLEAWNAMVSKTLEHVCLGCTIEQLDADLSRLFDAAMTTCLQKIGTVLQTRQAEHAKFTYVEWNRVLSRTNERLDRIQAVQTRIRANDVVQSSVNAGSSLRSVLYIQTKALVEEFHQGKVAEVHLLVGVEKWDAVTVTHDALVHLSIIYGVKAPLEATPSRELCVDSTSYLVVHSGLQLMRILCEYIEFCEGLPSISMECMQRLNHLLKLFHKQIATLILGGVAVQKQILKKITAGNLALCSQTCGMMSMLIPRVKERFLALFASSISDRLVSVVVSDMDTTAASFNEQRNGLLLKLAAILVDRYDAHAKKWFLAPHAELPESLESVLLPPHDSAEAFAKDLTNMHKVLSKNLSGEEVKRIFSTCYAEITQKFKNHLVEVAEREDDAVYTETHPIGDRFLHDIAALSQRLGSLDGIGDANALFLVDLLTLLSQHLKDRLNHASVEFLQQKSLLPTI